MPQRYRGLPVEIVLQEMVRSWSKVVRGRPLLLSGSSTSTRLLGSKLTSKHGVSSFGHQTIDHTYSCISFDNVR